LAFSDDELKFIRPTTEFWQTLHTSSEFLDIAGFALSPPFKFGYPARLPDGRYLVLPIRRLLDQPECAVASLIANQASFSVIHSLASMMSDIAKRIPHDVIVGLPTLGMVFAPLVAQGLGQQRYTPLGYSRKFWYNDELSTTVQSLTTPNQTKRIYLDPNQLSLISGQRVLIVDDAISTGGTMAAVIELLTRLGAVVTGVLVAMRQGEQWRTRLKPTQADQVAGAFDSPRLVWKADGWWPE
jgi:adenine/guanine phosphoribosyltransferase-like PRPP-binding protein